MGRRVRGFSKRAAIAWGFSDMNPKTRDYWQARVTRRTPALDLGKFHRSHPILQIAPHAVELEKEVLVDVGGVRVRGRVRGKRAEYNRDRPWAVTVRAHPMRSKYGRLSVRKAHLRKTR